MTSIDHDFGDLAVTRVPVKRAAYSRRTARTMAILAETGLHAVDEESEQHVLDLVEEFATLTDRERIAERSARSLMKALEGGGPAA